MKTADIIPFTGVKYRPYFDFWKQPWEHCKDGFVFGQKTDVSSTGKRWLHTRQFQLDAQLSSHIFKLVNNNDLGIYVTLIAGISALLHKYSGQEYIIIDSPLLGQPAEQITQRVPLIIPFGEDKTWKEQLKSIQGIVKETYKYQQYPLRLIDKESTDDKNVFSSNILVGYNALHKIPDETYDWIINFERDGEVLKADISYSQDVFDEGFITRAWGHLTQLLTNLYNSDVKLSESSIFSENEWKLITEQFNDNKDDYPADKTLHLLFEDQVKRVPDNMAVSFGDTQLTYQQLNEWADKLAYCLRERHQVKPNDIVGILMNRSERTVIAVLGILKAGAAFLPVDPLYPEERKAFMLADAGVNVLLTDTELMFDIPFYKGSIFSMDIELPGLITDKDYPAVISQPQDLAYVIYTSGSTGKPKGVMVRHQGVVNMITAQQKIFGVNEQDKVLQFASLSFDAAVFEMFMALANGITLVLLEKRIIDSIDLFEDYIRQQKVSIATLPPSYLSNLNKENLRSLRVIITAGEAANVQDAVACSAFCNYFNAYGPTEASVCVSTFKVSQSDAQLKQIPIGKPIANMEVYVLNEAGEIVAIGLTGELYVSGIGLAAGYLNNEVLTSQRFVELPSLPGKRLYKTGDLVRWSASGDLEFVGRSDEQFKLRGFRIESGEISSLLNQHPGVQESFVTKGEGEELLAVIVPNRENAAILHTFMEKKKSGKLNTHTFPNGMVVIFKNRFEADVLYREIFEDKTYHRGGIALRENATILDVGANIGMFSLYAGLSLDKAKIYAFEPVGDIYDLLVENTALYHLDIKAFQIGLSNIAEEVSFTYYPNNTALSGKYADVELDRKLVRKAIMNLTSTEDALPEESMDILLDDRMSARQIKCRMRRLSDVIADENLTEIDLLKIDVERCEMEVLEGIDEGDWSKIRQIVMEIDDEDGKLADLQKLLREKGYRVVVEESEDLMATGLFNVYAIQEDWHITDNSRTPALNTGKYWTSEASLISDLKTWSQSHLPYYMVPSVFMVMGTLPLTTNGKTDKKKLLQLQAALSNTGNNYVAAGNEIEVQLTALWEDILSKSPIGIRDNFFDLGGHSLKATRLVSGIYKTMQVNIDLGSVFSNPTIEEMARVIEKSGVVSYQEIPVLAHSEYYELSHAQRRLWILNQFEESKHAYSVPNISFLKDVDKDILGKAIQMVIFRHESLRTTFKMVEGEPRQIIHPAADFEFNLRYIDLTDAVDVASSVRAEVAAETAIPFDLENGPLLRAVLMKIEEGGYLFQLVMHHIICDGWSMHVLVKDLVTTYEALLHAQPNPLKPLRIQYKDYAAWQMEKLSGKGAGAYETYWLNQLGGEIPVLDLPIDFSRPVIKTFNGHYISQVLDQSVSREFKAFCQRKGVSLFVALTAVTKALLYRYTGQEDIVVGTTVAGRDHPDLEDQSGFYVNTLALRTKLSGNDSFDALLSGVQQTVLSAFNHQFYPFDLLVDKLDLVRDMSRSPLFDVLVEYLNVSPDETATTSWKVRTAMDEYTPAYTISKYDLSFKFDEVSEGLMMFIEYNTDLFLKERIESMLLHFQEILQSILKDSKETISRLSFIPQGERDMIVNGFNQSHADYIPAKTIAQLFEEQALSTPEQTAVIFRENTHSYRELNQLANHIAHSLMATGFVVPGQLTGILLERSDMLVATVLAVLKTGSAFLFIDPAYPLSRKKYILEDAGVGLLVTDSNFMFELADVYRKELYAIDIQLAPMGEVADYPAPSVEGDSLAYQLYTSGSTGEPKGVQIAHKSLVNYIVWANHHYFDNKQGYHFPLFTNLSFDLTLTSLFTTLLRGDQLVIYENKEIDILLSDIFSGNTRLKAAKITPAHVDILRELNPGTTKIEKVIIGGEALKQRHIDVLRKLNPDIRIYNEYGPTETTVGSTVKEIGFNAERITIGIPIANTSIYILDKNLQLLPVGVPGEICIGGAGVAIGYCNKPSLTSAVFIPNPVNADDRIYRTGDLGKWLSDGEIVLSGRKDHQIKIRGYRVEPGEIEQVLLQYNDMENVVVLAIGHGEEVESLAAFYESSSRQDPMAIRQYLSEYLPQYMIPAQLLQVDKIPLTANDKTDRRQLLQLLKQEDGTEGQAYVAPESDIEKELVDIWQSVLGKERIGICDDFFKVGGHSLKATQIIVRVYQKLNVILDISSIFLSPTIQRLAVIIADKQQSVYQQIPKLPEQAFYEVSPTQKRLWITEQLTAGLGVYNSFGSYLFEGKLETHVFEKVLHTLTARHEMLRTTFINIDGVPRLKVHPADAVNSSINYTDLRLEENREELARNHAEKDARATFDMVKGPLFRVRLIQMEEESFIFLFTMHHIISDGWSLNLLINEFLMLYNAFSNDQENPLPALNIQYKDYAGWLHNILNGNILNDHKEYWRTRFSGEIPLLNLPMEHPRPKVKSFNGSIHTTMLDKELSASLQAFCEENGVSLFISLLASLKALFYRYTNQEDIIIGTVEAGRNHPDLENQIGIYLNMLAFRTQFSGSDDFKSLVKKVKHTVLGAYEHMVYPFDQMLEDLQIKWDASHNPLFDVMLSFENTSTAVGQGDGFEQMAVRDYRQEIWSSIFDLVINVKESPQGLIFHFCYNTDLYSSQFIERLAGHYAGIIAAVVKNTSTPVHALEYLSDNEINALTTGFNHTLTTFPDTVTMHGLFEEQVSRTPENTAVIFEDRSLSYHALNQQANRLAHYLREAHGVKPGDIIGVMMEKSEQAVVSILGILKSGAAYLPVDPAYPEERKQYIIEDAGVKVLLTHSSFVFDLEFYKGVLFATDLQLEKLTEKDENPEDVNTPEDAAYVIYTSGSTGQPKGVVIAHRSNINMALDQIGRFGVTSRDKVLQFASLSFDASVYEITIGLFSGAGIVIADKKIIQRTDNFIRYLREKEVSVATLPPAYLRILDLNELSFLRVIITAGEAANVKDAVSCSLQSDYYNAYGPTEAAVCVSVYKVSGEDGQRWRIPIGAPIANTALLILDEYNQLVPIGVEGELCISGVGLAKGYLNRPALTAAKFVPHPFFAGERIYKTGDVCRRLEDGMIDYVGRNDHQVKLRGFRIELEEIATVLRSYENAKDAYVILYERQEERKLIAFWASDSIATAEDLRTFCLSRMPEYMCPDEIIMLTELPLNIHGKIDRNALTGLLESTRTTDKENLIQPRNEFEQKLVDIWAAALHKQQFGVTSNFFDIGGNSLNAAQIVSAIYKQLQVQVELVEMFQFPTIESLSQLIMQADRIVYEPIPFVPDAAYYDISHAQRRILIEAQMEWEQQVYNLSGGYMLEKLDRSAFETACNALVERHEILRTTFEKVDGDFKQKVHTIEKAPFTLDYRELNEYEEPLAYVKQLMEAESSAPFDLFNGPLYRAKLLYIGDDKYVFLFTVHHIIFDAQSMRIAIREILEQYKGISPAQPPLRVQYKDYTAWQNNRLQGKHLEDHQAYWKKQFGGNIPVLKLPTDFSRPAVKTFGGAGVSLDIDPESLAGINKLSQENSLTTFMTLQALVDVLLYRFTRQTDITLGVAEAGRNHPDLESQIGFYINSLPLRVRFNAEDTFMQLLNRVKENTMSAYRHMDYPFDMLVQDLQLKRDPSRSPLFDVSILYEESDFNSEDTQGTVSGEMIGLEQSTSLHDLKFAFIRLNDRISGQIVYNVDLFEQRSIEYMKYQFMRVLEECINRPDQSILDICAAVMETEVREPDTYNISEVDF